MNAARKAMGAASPAMILRILALFAAAIGVLFVVNNFLIFWHGWPGVLHFLGHLGLFGLALPSVPLGGPAILLGWVQLLAYVGSFVGIVAFVILKPGRTMQADADVLTAFVAYSLRSAFWAILLIGVVDATISFFRVEGMLEQIVGVQMSEDLGRASFRGAYIHYPLIPVGFVIGYFTRTLGFIWLAFLIVIAELLIVIARFVFSYEQTFMGDLVRFWYAGLFLFASAYTLIEEGHVRVDILYTSFSDRGKAWTNTLGSLFLGLPVCWIILTMGMWSKSNLININTQLLILILFNTTTIKTTSRINKFIISPLLYRIHKSLTNRFFIFSINRIKCTRSLN